MDAGFWEVVFKWLQMLIGVVVTGVALSFGLKFWHDIVGILYEVKEARAKVAGRK